jgi:hypothetical protein
MAEVVALVLTASSARRPAIPATSVARLKADVADDLNRWGQATEGNRLPTALDAAVGIFTADASRRSEERTLRQYIDYARAEDVSPYSDYRFTVDQWLSVQVRGASARVRLRGHGQSEPNGRTLAGDPAQDDIRLSFEHGRWKIVSRRTTFEP